MKRSKKPRKTNPAWRRARGVPITIYLSEEESATFRAKAAAKNRTLSDQVRYWINFQPKRKSATEAEPVDPRQTNIEDITTRPEGEALAEWAEREGKTEWLRENLS